VTWWKAAGCVKRSFNHVKIWFIWTIVVHLDNCGDRVESNGSLSTSQQTHHIWSCIRLRRCHCLRPPLQQIPRHCLSVCLFVWHCFWGPCTLSHEPNLTVPAVCMLVWLLQDGTIQLEMKLTGILSTSVMNLGDRSSQHGVIVAPGATGFGLWLGFRVDDVGLKLWGANCVSVLTALHHSSARYGRLGSGGWECCGFVFEGSGCKMYISPHSTASSWHQVQLNRTGGWDMLIEFGVQGAKHFCSDQTWITLSLH
jgi:hypothetical protein